MDKKLIKKIIQDLIFFNLNEFNMKISKYLSLVLDREIREIQEISQIYHKN